MAFTNKNNKITVKGFLSSNITEVPNSSYALTFMIKVPRPAQQDRRIIYDEFMLTGTGCSAVRKCFHFLLSKDRIHIS